MTRTDENGQTLDTLLNCLRSLEKSSDIPLFNISKMRSEFMHVEYIAVLNATMRFILY